MPQYLENKFKRIDILPVLALSFISGIISQHFFNFNFLISLFLCAIFLALAFISANKAESFIIFLSLSFFLLGIISLSNRNSLPKNHIKNFKEFQYLPVQISGTVISKPRIRESKISFNVLIKTICRQNSSVKATGKILVFADEKTAPKIYLADIVKIKGRLSRPFRFNSGEEENRNVFDYRDFLQRQDIYFIIRLKDGADVKVIGIDRKYLFLRKINNIRDFLDSQFFKYLPELSATLYSALLLGIREGLYQDLSGPFVKTGTAHILAISGLNVGIVIFIVLFFLKGIGIKRRPRLILSAIFIIFYSILSGMQSPVLRATIMALFIIFGFLIERELSIITSLALAAFLLLIFQPGYIFDIGFQLSFIAVLGMIFLSPMISQILERAFLIFFKNPKIFKKGLIKILINTFAVSLAAYLSVLPLIVYNFNIITPSVILANMVVVPAFTLITALGFAFLIFATFSPAWAGLFSKVLGLSSAILVHIVLFFSRLPFSHIYLKFKISKLGVVIYYLLISLAYRLISKNLKLRDAPSNGPR